MEILQLNKSAWIFSCVNNRALPDESPNPSYYTMHNITFKMLSYAFVGARIFITKETSRWFYKIKAWDQIKVTLRNSLFIGFKKVYTCWVQQIKNSKKLLETVAIQYRTLEVGFLYSLFYNSAFSGRMKLAFFLSFYKLCKNLKTHKQWTNCDINQKKTKQKKNMICNSMSPSLLLYT